MNRYKLSPERLRVLAALDADPALARLTVRALANRLATSRKIAHRALLSRRGPADRTGFALNPAGAAIRAVIAADPGESNARLVELVAERFGIAVRLGAVQKVRVELQGKGAAVQARERRSISAPARAILSRPALIAAVVQRAGFAARRIGADQDDATSDALARAIRSAEDWVARGMEGDPAAYLCSRAEFAARKSPRINRIGGQAAWAASAVGFEVHIFVDPGLSPVDQAIFNEEFARMGGAS